MKTLLRVSLLLVTLLITNNLFSQIPAPVGESSVYFCEAENVTLNDMLVSNTDGYSDIYWFLENNTSGEVLALDTFLENETTYYAFQAIDDAAESLTVTVYITASILAPTGEYDQHYTISENPTLADLEVYNTDGFDTILWFTDHNQTTELSPNTPLVDETTYYAFQGFGNCANGLAVQTCGFIPAPLGDTTQYFCELSNATIADLFANNTYGFDEILWYAVCCPILGYDIPISPDTLLENGVTYYANQGIACEYGYLGVQVVLTPHTPPPIGEADQYFCSSNNPTLADIVVYNTDGFDTIIWSNTSYGEEPLNPTTSLVDGVTYYAFQGWGDCANSLAVNVHIMDAVPAPTGETTQNFSDLSSITLADLEVFNTEAYANLYFSLEPDCGEILDLNTQPVCNTTYYASQIECPCDICCVLSLPITVTCATGLDEFSQNAFSLFPNPVDKILTIQSTESITQLEIILYNLQAQKIFTTTNFVSDNKTQIDVSNFTSGVYFVQINSKNKTISKRLMIE